MTSAVLILIAAWLVCAGLTLALCAAAGRADGARAFGRSRVRTAEPKTEAVSVDVDAPPVLVPAAAGRIG